MLRAGGAEGGRGGDDRRRHRHRCRWWWSSASTLLYSSGTYLLGGVDDVSGVCDGDLLQIAIIVVDSKGGNITAKGKRDNIFCGTVVVDGHDK